MSLKKSFVTVMILALAVAGLSVPGVVHAEEKAAQATKGLPRIIDLGADKCIPCIMMAPILEELKKEYAGRLEVEFIDVWRNPNAGKKYGIRGIPTQIFYDGSGKELGRHMGFISKEQILQSFNKFGIEIRKTSGEKKSKNVAGGGAAQERAE